MIMRYRGMYCHLYPTAKNWASTVKTAKYREYKNTFSDINLWNINSNIKCAAFCEMDGYVSANQTGNAYSKALKENKVKIFYFQGKIF